MTDTQYQLNSVLPFDVSEHDGDAQRMLSDAPLQLWESINRAEKHRDEVEAYDALGNWIAQNWRTYFPGFSV